MFRTTITASALVLLGAIQAQAEQYAVRVNIAFEGANSGLLEALKITEIDRFTVAGKHFVILEAPNQDYVEAYVLAIGRKAVELNSLDADWTHPQVTEMPLGQRLSFLRPIYCGYCIG